MRMAGETMDETVSNEQRSESRQKLEKWLNKSMRIKMTDGRTLVGIFLCTDSDCNIIMGSCEEYLKPVEHIPKEDPRILGLAMIPGKHVISIEIDETLISDVDGEYTVPAACLVFQHQDSGKIICTLSQVLNYTPYSDEPKCFEKSSSEVQETV